MNQSKIWQIINCGLTILVVSVYPMLLTNFNTAQDLALLTNEPVFLQNAFGNCAYVNQTNLKGKLRKKLGGPSKNLEGHGSRRPAPLESPLTTDTPRMTRFK